LTPLNHIDNYPPDVYETLISTLEDMKQGKPLGVNFKGVITVPLDVKALYRILSPDPNHWPVFVDKMSDMWRHSPTFTKTDLAQIEAPTLVVSVDHDEFLPPEVFEATAESIPHSTLDRIPKGTHSVPVEYPAKVNRMLLDFLDTE